MYIIIFQISSILIVFIKFKKNIKFNVPNVVRE